MRILVVGGKGTIGQAIVEKLKDKHELIIAGRTSGDVQVDLTSVASIEAMFNKVGHVDGKLAFLVLYGPANSEIKTQETPPWILRG